MQLANPITVLITPIPGLENITQIMTDASITLSNISSERGYARLYRMPARYRLEAGLLFLYKQAANTWINEAGASNYMTSAEYLNLLGAMETIRKTCECYPITTSND